MKELKSTQVKLKDDELKRRESFNREYLMKLSNDNLLLNFKLEAGRYSGRELGSDAHKGWESPVCQLRGHFLGHWLSAAAIHYNMSSDMELKSKADAIVDELAECQKDNGGQWAGPIPEKYLYWIAEGKPVWAPQYTLHKVFMGLVDMYLYGKNQKALEVADRFADWFVEWSGRYSRDKFDDILDIETGGMLEVWAELLHITGKDKYRILLQRYYRDRLFGPLLAGKDPLTNMHANTTIPEALGCARAYEVTGDEKWLEIVRAYWNCAVVERGCLATGGQTSGEIWMPKMKMKQRLGDKNQEHCTVYNMIRLAEFLFRQTKDPSYMQYIEYNLYNGIMAQAYYKEYTLTGCKHNHPSTGLLTYFLPMKAGLHKDWSGETDSFFCCHGTMVQANAALNKGIYYTDNDEIFICQYFDSELNMDMGGTDITILQKQDKMSGSLMSSSNTAGSQEVNEVMVLHENVPMYRKHDFVVRTTDRTFTLNFRIPEWIMSEAAIYVKGSLHGKTSDNSKFYSIRREWKDGDTVSILLPIGVRFIPLPDDEETGAFRFGPDVLAGLCDKERLLFIDFNKDIASEIVMENEREWGNWRYFFKTENQNPVIEFRRIRDIGYEPYQIYFKLKHI